MFWQSEKSAEHLHCLAFWVPLPSECKLDNRKHPLWTIVCKDGVVYVLLDFMCRGGGYHHHDGDE